MKTFVSMMLCVVSAVASGCEVADLPPLAEVRDARDTQHADSADTSPNPSDSVDVPDMADIADTFDHDIADAEPDTPDMTDAADTFDHETADTVPDTFESVDVPDHEPDVPDTSDSHSQDAQDAQDTTSPVCTPVTATYDPIASPHVTTCSEVSYPTEPPTSGPHYPIWAAFKTYGVAINPGFLVHAIEHGAVVLTWRCPGGCDADLAALQAMLDARQADPLCDPLIKHRIIVAPRPDQDVMLSAWAWGASWKADCFDLSSLSAFIDSAYAKGPEDFCSQGVDIEAILPDNAWHCPP